MQQSLRNIRNILIYALVISLISLAYFVYAYSIHPIPEERETFLTGIGEGFGKAGLGLLAFIYLFPHLAEAAARSRKTGAAPAPGLHVSD